MSPTRAYLGTELSNRRLARTMTGRLLRKADRRQVLARHETVTIRVRWVHRHALRKFRVKVHRGAFLVTDTCSSKHRSPKRARRVRSCTLRAGVIPGWRGHDGGVVRIGDGLTKQRVHLSASGVRDRLRGRTAAGQRALALSDASFASAAGAPVETDLIGRIGGSLFSNLASGVVSGVGSYVGGMVAGIAVHEIMRAAGFPQDPSIQDVLDQLASVEQHLTLMDATLDQIEENQQVLYENSVQTQLEVETVAMAQAESRINALWDQFMALSRSNPSRAALDDFADRIVNGSTAADLEFLRGTLNDTGGGKEPAIVAAAKVLAAQFQPGQTTAKIKTSNGGTVDAPMSQLYYAQLQEFVAYWEAVEERGLVLLLNVYRYRDAAGNGGVMPSKPPNLELEQSLLVKDLQGKRQDAQLAGLDPSTIQTSNRMLVHRTLSDSVVPQFTVWLTETGVVNRMENDYVIPTTNTDPSGDWDPDESTFAQPASEADYQDLLQQCVKSGAGQVQACLQSFGFEKKPDDSTAWNDSWLTTPTMSENDGGDLAEVLAGVLGGASVQASRVFVATIDAHTYMPDVHDDSVVWAVDSQQDRVQQYVSAPRVDADGNTCLNALGRPGAFPAAMFSLRTNKNPDYGAYLCDSDAWVFGAGSKSPDATSTPTSSLLPSIVTAQMSRTSDGKLRVQPVTNDDAFAAVAGGDFVITDRSFLWVSGGQPGTAQLLGQHDFDADEPSQQVQIRPVYRVAIAQGGQAVLDLGWFAGGSLTLRDFDAGDLLNKL